MPAAPPFKPGPPQDPSDPEVWKRAYLLLLPKASKLVHNPALAREILQDAMLKASTAGPARWDPARAPLYPHLLWLLRGLASNELGRAVHRRETHDDLHIERAADPSPTALEILVERERIRVGAAIVAEVREELVATEDDEAIRVLDVIGDDAFKPSQIAAATGLGVDKVDNARKRIRRVYTELIARPLPKRASTT